MSAIAIGPNMPDSEWDHELYQGLRSLAESAFPKRCSSCGRVFGTADQFIRETERVRGQSGLKQSLDDEEAVVLELYRNCPCGSTLMDVFGDRRDLSHLGQERRDRFARVLQTVLGLGMGEVEARVELLKVLRGESSAALERLRRRGGQRD